MECIHWEWPHLNDGYAYVNKLPGCQHAGQSVLAYYSTCHSKTATQEQWIERIEAGQVLLNGETATSSAILPPNAVLQYLRPPWQEADVPNSLEILYVDNDVMAVSKPSGLQVLPGALFQQRCVLTLLQRYGKMHSLPAGCPAPVHRLGRGTSGVLLCACSPGAKRALATGMQDKTLNAASSGSLAEGRAAGAHSNESTMPAIGRKVYRALVSNIVEAEQGEVEVLIGRVPRPGVAGGVWAVSPHGRHAKSTFRVLERRECTTLVQVEILTGRPHQIRIHMASLGHPLVGDPLYGPDGLPKETCHAVPGDCGYLLHAEAISFTHPTTGTGMTLRAPPPPALRCRGESMEFTSQNGAA